MNLDEHLTTLRDDLSRSLSLADEPTRHTADRLVTTLEPALRLAMIELLSQACAEVTAQLSPTVVGIAMDGRDPRLVVQASEPAPAEEPTSAVVPSTVEDDTETARITLRLPENVKSRAEAAAQASGVSLNTWLTNAARVALDQPTTTRKQNPRRVTGWA